jgi:pimeloyl-ACP methyl ester carboxylesterase
MTIAESDCHLGAYRNGAGHLLTLQTDEGGGLRFYLMDGRSGLLEPSPQGSSGYTARPGWSTTEPPVGTADLGDCASNAIEFNLEGGPDGLWTKIPLQVQDTKFASRGVSLSARWVRPPGTEAGPAVIFVHGSGATASIDATNLQWLLPAEGISVFVFDKRGTGRSEGAFTHNFEILADDVVAAIGELRRLGGRQITRLGLAGFSQGGWVAPLAATKTPVDFIIVGYGVAGSPVEQDVWQVAYQLADRGYGPDVLAKAQRVCEAAGNLAATDFRGSITGLRALQAQYAGEAWLAKVDGQYSGELLRGEIERVRRESPGVIWSYDAMRVLRALKIPQLWIMAGADSVAPSGPSIARLQALQQELQLIDIALFPDTDHRIVEFKVTPDGRREKTRAADGYFRLQVDWIKGRLSPPYGRAQLIPALSR